MTEMMVQEINAGLKIVKLKGQKFSGRFGMGYYVPTGECLYHENLGYMAFKNSPFMPYVPNGGRKALVQFMTGGGLRDLEHVIWVKPLEL